MKLSKSIPLTLVWLLLSSCATVYITEYAKAPGFVANGQRSKSVTVAGFEPVVVTEFINTYSKNFFTNQDFVKKYTGIFERGLRSSMLFASVVYDSSSAWKVTRFGSLMRSDLDALDAQFNSCKTDYLITITDFAVRNRLDERYGTTGPNNMSNTTSAEYCVIEARFVMFEVATRKKVLEFVSRGEQSVAFFAYESALMKAINASITHAQGYLSTGKKEF